MRIVTTLFATLAVSTTLWAQQLPDPGFEDWSGEVFKKAEQPRYWNYSNVIQFGFKFNFAHPVAGRSGKAVLVKNQAMKVMGIDGGTSPGYISLGQPWTYIPGLNKIPYATAGTYGGISWKARPDSIEMWIKRDGPRWQDENYNIVFYMWRGQGYGRAYNSAAGCTEIPQEFRNVVGGGLIDEESDIRMGMDGNTCGHITTGEEIGEAYLSERAQYTDWHKVVIPIYYLSDRLPEKCNLILSAGNYPAGKATTGIYADNSLTVDDVRLIYASTIDRLVIDGVEWTGFDAGSSSLQHCPAKSSQPSIRAYRGVGELTNHAGEKQRFEGRELTAKEMEIIYGQPTKIIVKAADGSNSHIYLISFDL